MPLVDEYDPESSDRKAQLHFVEFIEQVIMCREAAGDENTTSYAIEEGGNIELVGKVMSVVSDCKIEGASAFMTFITVEDVREAIGLYMFLKEGRGILVSPMGRALIREAQVGGSKWAHLYHIYNGPSLWDGEEPEEGPWNILEDKEAMKTISEEWAL